MTTNSTVAGTSLDEELVPHDLKSDADTILFRKNADTLPPRSVHGDEWPLTFRDAVAGPAFDNEKMIKSMRALEKQVMHHPVMAVSRKLQLGNWGKIEDNIVGEGPHDGYDGLGMLSMCLQMGPSLQLGLLITMTMVLTSPLVT